MKVQHIVAILIAMICAGAGSAQDQSSISPASTYDQAGVTVVSPNQSGWILLKSDKLETVFGKRDKDGIVSANIKIIKTKTFETDRELLASLETLKQEELNKLRRDSIHFNNVRFKGSSCLQYDGTFTVDGTSSPKFPYFNLKGYVCLLPQTKDFAVQLEFSNYSNQRGFSEKLFSLSDEFFEKVVFPKAAVK